VAHKHWRKMRDDAWKLAWANTHGWKLFTVTGLMIREDEVAFMDMLKGVLGE